MEPKLKFSHSLFFQFGSESVNPFMILLELQSFGKSYPGLKISTLTNHVSRKIVTQVLQEIIEKEFQLAV
jgi:hypothetical protein